MSASDRKHVVVRQISLVKSLGMLNSAAIKRLVTVADDIRQSAEILPTLKLLYARIAITIFEDAVDLMEDRDVERVSVQDVLDAVTDLSEEIMARDAVLVRCSPNSPAFPLCVHVPPTAFKRLIDARRVMYHPLPQIAVRARELLHFATEQLFVKFIDQLAKRFARHRDAHTLKRIDVATAIDAFTAFRHIRGIPVGIANNLSPPPRQRSDNRNNNAIGQQNNPNAAAAAPDGAATGPTPAAAANGPTPAAAANTTTAAAAADAPPADASAGQDDNDQDLDTDAPHQDDDINTAGQGVQQANPAGNNQQTPLPMPPIPPVSLPPGPSRPRRTRRPPAWLADYETRLDLRTLPRNLRVQRIPHDQNNLVTAVVRAYNSQTDATGSDRLTAAICHDMFEEEGLDATEDNTREQLNLLASKLKVSIAVHDAEYKSIILYGKSRRRIFIRRTLHYDAYVR